MKTRSVRKKPVNKQGWKREYKQVEKAIQKEYVKWLKANYDVEVIHIPNEGDIPPQYRKLLIAMGLDPGACDLIILWALQKILFHELKKKDGRTSPAQTAFSKRVNDMGFEYCVTYGLEQAKMVPLKFDFPLNPHIKAP